MEVQGDHGDARSPSATWQVSEVMGVASTHPKLQTLIMF